MKPKPHTTHYRPTFAEELKLAKQGYRLIVRPAK